MAERIALLIDEGLNDVGGSVGWATVESMAHFLANSFGAAPEFAVRLFECPEYTYRRSTFCVAIQYRSGSGSACQDIRMARAPIGCSASTLGLPSAGLPA